jgi:acylphosphatase
MSDPICRRCLVQGRVQGVFFRASTARVAEGLGVTGHALNLADGRVEVLACGPPEAVDELCRWLRHGPPSARVDALECADAGCGDGAPAGFITG